jgi:hypothetical protein
METDKIFPKAQKTMGVGILYICTPCLFSIEPDRLTRNPHSATSNRKAFLLMRNPQSAIRNWKG